MTRDRRSFLAAGAALVAGVVPASAAPVPKHLMPKDEQPLFFPTTVGSRHVSEWQGTEIVCVVAKVEKTADGIVVTEERVLPKGIQTPEQTVVVSAKGLHVTHYRDKPLDPPIWYLKLPHVENNNWTDQWAQTTRYLKTVGWEEIEVPAGKIRAMRVDRDNDGKGTSITTYWYAPGMGCIKWASKDSKRELKSFTPGK
jgi:hypothetical protein